MKAASLSLAVALVFLAGCAWLRPPTESSSAYQKSGYRPGDSEETMGYPHPGMPHPGAADTRSRVAERDYNQWKQQTIQRIGR